MAFPVDPPMDADEYRAFVEQIRVEAWLNAGNLTEAIPQLRIGLREGLMGRGVGRADARMTARRVTRPLVIAARFQLDSAQSAVRSYHLFLDKVLNHKSAPTSARFKL